MDKYEYKLKLDELKKLVAAEDYRGAAEIADMINWKKVRNTSTLCMVGDVYDHVGRYDACRDVLLQAYNFSPIGRNIVRRLVKNAIRTHRLDDAQEYYAEFVEIAPKDNQRYIFAYQISCLKDSPLADRIAILEELKEKEYTEVWAYELAALYGQADMRDQCVAACDELILWFGDGPYVEKALDLKRRYQPLTSSQEEKYQQSNGQKGVVEFSISKRTEAVDSEAEKADVTVTASTFNAAGLQEELERRMQEIADATQKDTVSETMEDIKRLVSDIPYLSGENDPDAAHAYDTDLINEKVDDKIRRDFEKLMQEEQGSQEAASEAEESVETPEEVRASIQGVLAEWEKTKHAAEAAIEAAEKQKLELTKQKALEETGEIMDRLMTLLPVLSATPGEDLPESDDTMAERLLANETQTAENVDAETAQSDGTEDAAPQQDDADARKKNEDASVSESEEEAKSEAQVSESNEETKPTEATSESEKEAESTDATAESGEEAESTDATAESGEEAESTEAASESGEEAASTETASESETEAASTEETASELGDKTETAEKTDETKAASENTEKADQIEAADSAAAIEEILNQAMQGFGEGETTDAAAADADRVTDTSTQFAPKDPDAELEKLLAQAAQRFAENSDVKVPVSGGTAPKPAAESSEEKQEAAGSEQPGVQSAETDRARASVKLPVTSGKSAAGEELTPEERKLFSYFLAVPGMEEQLKKAMNGASRRVANSVTSLTGNILIEGEEGSGKTVLATSLIKAIQKKIGNEDAKIGKISAASLNRKDFSAIIPRIDGGYLIVDKAGALTQETVIRMSQVMERNTRGMVVVLEDTHEGIEHALSLDFGFAKKFSERVTISAFSIDELVTFGKSYAREMECEIDEMGVLALYNRINNIQKLEHVTTLTEVKEIVDHAIESAEGGGLKKLFSRKYNESDYLILREKDFE